ncbi:response regulator [Desulfonatronum thiosulfatophilum]|nr:response regulator [Desulfonatronum thiosulfatophilum]
MRILFVDDEVAYLSTIIKRLKSRGYQVHGAASGAEALEYLHLHDVDVVVMDVKMPGMDGLSVLREMKRSWPLMEVIMLTGHASVESGIQGMEMGAFDYVMKPARLEELLQKLQQAYERRSLAIAQSVAL